MSDLPATPPASPPPSTSSPKAPALSNWEDEGGAVGTASVDIHQRAYLPCVPALPPGYEAQPAWGFRDSTGRFSYEFHRVYGPPDPADKNERRCVLDEQRCYWGVTWSTWSATGDEHPAGRWLTFAQALALPGPRRTYDRFSSHVHMHDELPLLLHVADVGGADKPAQAPIPKNPG